MIFSYLKSSVTEGELRELHFIPDVKQALPYKWRQITEKEFAQSIFFVHSPIAVAYEQFYWDEFGNRSERMIAARLYFFHNKTGLALESDYWAGKVHYYAFGCAHEFREVTFNYIRENLGYNGPGRLSSFDHVMLCSKCNYYHVINSSD